MHLHLPKPLHGWREFVGEVGIIVIGVLIALGAEQLVQSITWHHEIQETRQALDAELTHDLSGFEYRQMQQSCIEKRLAELTIVLGRQRRGVITQLKHEVVGPLGISLHFAVWEAATGEARARMPLQVKLQYAALYDLFRNFRDLRDRESTNWEQLEDLDFSAKLTSEQLQQARANILHLQRNDALLPNLVSFVRSRADPLHIRSDPNVIAPARAYARQRLQIICAPLI